MDTAFDQIPPSLLDAVAPPAPAAPTDPSAVNTESFLTLLVTQLRNQDPLEPTKNEEFLAQLATFSSLEEQQKTNAGLKDLLLLEQAKLTLAGLSQGASLIGKEVEYLDPATGNQIRGTVLSIFFDQSGVLAEIDGEIVPLGNIVIVSGDFPELTPPTTNEEEEEDEGPQAVPVTPTGNTDPGEPAATPSASAGAEG